MSETPQGNRFQRAWTPESVTDAIHAWAEEYGKPPTSTEWEIGKPGKYAAAALAKARSWHEKAARFDAGTYPSNDTVRRLFGSFNAALHQAGFEPRPPGRTPRDLTDRQMMQLRARRNGDGAGPSQLAVQVRGVLAAQAAKDQMALRSALYDLAAVAMAWCDQLDAKIEQEAAA